MLIEGERKFCTLACATSTGDRSSMLGTDLNSTVTHGILSISFDFRDVDHRGNTKCLHDIREISRITHDNRQIVMRQ